MAAKAAPSRAARGCRANASPHARAVWQFEPFARNQQCSRPAATTKRSVLIPTKRCRCICRHNDQRLVSKAPLLIARKRWRCICVPRSTPLCPPGPGARSVMCCRTCLGRCRACAQGRGMQRAWQAGQVCPRLTVGLVWRGLAADELGPGFHQARSRTQCRRRLGPGSAHRRTNWELSQAAVGSEPAREFPPQDSASGRLEVCSVRRQKSSNRHLSQLRRSRARADSATGRA